MSRVTKQLTRTCAKLERAPLDSFSFLQECSGEALSEGKRADDHAATNGNTQMYPDCGSLDDFCNRMQEPNVFSWNTMIAACARNGRVQDARDLFDGMPQRNVVSCTALLAAYAQHGVFSEAKSMFDDMPQRNIVSWNAMVGGYAQNGYLQDAKTMFEKMPEWNRISWNALIQCYAQNAYLGEATSMFADMPELDVVSCNNMVAAYAQNGHLEYAKSMFNRMHEKDIVSWNTLITAYAQNMQPNDAKLMFEKMPQRNVVSWNAMVQAYVLNGHFEDARVLFQEIRERDVVSWTTMIAAFAQNGELNGAKELFDQMPLRNVISWNAMIQAFAENGQLQDVKRMFEEMPERDVLTWNVMITAYARNGHADEAKSMFDQITKRTVVSWNAMLTAYAQNGHMEHANSIFGKMPEWNLVSWNALLQAFAKNEPSEDGKSAFGAMLGAYTQHGQLEDARSVFDEMPEHNIISWNAMVQAYAESGNLQNAELTFDRMPQRDIASWTVMMTGYTQNGYARNAFELFRVMDLEGVKPSEITFIGILDACVSLSAVAEGESLHKDIVDSGLNSDIAVATALVNMYSKCGKVEDAKSVFEDMPRQDLVSWTTMIAAYAQNGRAKEALELFRRMGLEGVQPQEITFVSALHGCASLPALVQGKIMHSNIVEAGLESSALVATALIKMYGQCGCLELARSIFERTRQQADVSLWNAMILAYCQSGNGEDAVTLFGVMGLEGVQPDRVTFVTVIDTCAKLSALRQGRSIHANIVANGAELNVVEGTALVNMYGKCKCPEAAKSTFDTMLQRNVVSWTAMIAAYTQSGHEKATFELFRMMDLEGVKPDERTYVSILDACASVAELKEGVIVHSNIISCGLESDLVVGTALVNMYGKCGRLEEARGVFERMPIRSVFTWTSIVAACAQNGLGIEALQLFQRMELEGVKPDSVTFISVLAACSHAGRTDDGRYYFVSMSREYGISAAIEHFVWMIDLLGRSGRVQEAEELINSMPFEPHAVAWMTLLGACKNQEQGARAAQRVFELDPEKGSPYVLLSNIHAAAGGAYL